VRIRFARSTYISGASTSLLASNCRDSTKCGSVARCLGAAFCATGPPQRDRKSLQLCRLGVSRVNVYVNPFLVIFPCFLTFYWWKSFRF
jgi:hypothetical protein